MPRRAVVVVNCVLTVLLLVLALCLLEVEAPGDSATPSGPAEREHASLQGRHLDR